MDYKLTLLMPKTDFEMKANLSIKEPKIQENWINIELDYKVQQKNKNFPYFILHDGPPYANGNIHVGHSLNKILKDIIIRYKNMNNFNAIYIPGWDTHGMPIEIELLKKGINNNSELSISEKRDNCSQFALNWIEKQKKQFLRLGMLSPMINIYRTLDNDYEIEQLKIFNKMLNINLIYQDYKPIYWSPSSKTALAEAEVEYKNIESHSIYVAFTVLESNILEFNDKLIIWTTTPWTIPSNLAIAVNADIVYSRVWTNKGVIIVSKSSLNKIFQKLKIDNYKLISEYKGSEFEGTTYKHPLYEKSGLVIIADYVSDSDGTGLVHNAPGFGHEDYMACKKYGIPPFCPINDSGVFTDEINDSELVFHFYDNVNDNIIDRLEKSRNLLWKEKIKHSAAHDWRTKKPLIYRSTKQWFVNISKIRAEINDALNSVTSIQGDSIINRIKEMINNRQEWCISRQRYWGVPIIIIYDENDIPLIDLNLQNKIISILKKEGINTWYVKDAFYFLPDNYDKSKKYRKEIDTMDVWFDSGTSHNILSLNKLPYPADLYFEGKDQFRGWFNSSLITGVAYHNKAPYKSLLCHGFVLDKDGKKMSKSLGNVVDPIKVCSEYGADVLRIWVASTDYSSDVRIFPELIKQNAEIYRRIRNTIFKFILGNLNDFNENDNVEYSDIDYYILYILKMKIKEILVSYENFDFKNIIKIINEFTIELSSWYFDYIKDYLYCERKNNPKRKGIQSVLHKIMYSYLIILNPIIPHTCEEAYSQFNCKEKKPSIQLEDFGNLLDLEIVPVSIERWNDFFNLKNSIFIKLEESRKNKIINKNNEAKVLIHSEKLPFRVDELVRMFNIAEIKYLKKSKFWISIRKTKYLKCYRCWNHVSKKWMYDNDICQRCFDVIRDNNF
ncbi:MAG: isoleucine--tRNA ligase [Mycoplasmoidaceae bacterium]